MSIFDHFFSSEPSPYVRIAQIITNDKAEFVEKIEESVENTRNFVEKNISDYLDRDIDVENESKEGLLWFALIHSLIEANYACELESKENLEELEWQLSQLKQLNNLDDLIDIELNEEDDIETWCNQINQRWQNKGICLVSFDIDEESKVIIPVEIPQLTALVNTVESIGQKVHLF